MSPSVWLGDDLSNEIKKNEHFHENIQNIVNDVVKGALDVTTLVERLSGVLTDIDPELRTRGLHLFSGVLKLLPTDFLSETQLIFIATFYADRLKDNHRVIPDALEGILGLIKMKHFPATSSSKVLMAISHNVPCQQQVRADRHTIYNIINLMTINYSDELITVAPDIVFGVIAAMDGERDPRCLMTLFSILPTFLQRMPLGHLVEEMFEVMACYFPIDFNSTPGDPNKITRNDLAEKLCICLCGTPAFAQYCLPLLLEKLDSSLKIAKLDSLNLLKQSCSVFNANHYDPHLNAIWACLQKEVSHKTDNELSQAAHDSLEALINNLCSEPKNARISLAFLEQIFRSSQLLLVDADSKIKFELPLFTLLTVAKGSEKSCIFVAENVISLIVLHFLTKSDDKMKGSLSDKFKGIALKWFSHLFLICKHWNVTPQTSSHFMSVPELCLSVVDNHDEELKNASFDSISIMTELFQPDQAMRLWDSFDFNIHKERLSSVSNASKKCLLSLASENPTCFVDFIDSRLSLDEMITEPFILERRLDMLSSLMSIGYFTDITLKKLLNFLNTSSVKDAIVLISTISNSLENKQLFSEIKIQQIQTEFDIVNNILCWTDRHICQLDDKSLNVISKTIIIIMQHQSAIVQSSILSNHVIQCLKRISEGNTIFIIILEALLNSCRKEVQIDNLKEIILKTFECVFKEVTPFVNNKASILIAHILNKQNKFGTLAVEYGQIRERIFTVLTDNKCNEIVSLNCIVFCSWITKSLLISGNSESSYWLLKLTETLSNETYGMQAAQGFKLIMSDSSEALNASCYCNINLFYRQRVFQQFLNWTTNSERDFKLDTRKEPCLLAWAYIIQSVPKSVLQMEPAKITNILIESLQFEELDLLIATLSTTSCLIQMNTPTIISSLQTLLPRCLKLISFKKSMDVRIGSLGCIFDIANSISTVHLIPYKQDMTFSLLPSLDDPKRLVRNMAVKARTRWFLVGSPGEEKEN